MIRVGFLLNHTTQTWQGGVSYLRNLFHALALSPSKDVQPVLVVPEDTNARFLSQFEGTEVVRSRLVGRPGRILRSVSERLFERDLPLERTLREHRIDVLSHFEYLGRKASIPSIGWLTDFQHRRMPDFFSKEELAARDRQFRQTIAGSSIVVLSSLDAQRDLRAFDPVAANNSRVLQFASGYEEPDLSVAWGAICECYGVAGPYFLVPNQFWAHKNHRLLIDALTHWKPADRPTVLATGMTRDYRHPAFYGELMSHAQARGVDQHFRPLGIVPFSHLAALMRHCVALINPSRFEGWSTSVEEGKSLGLRILLSDIPVHREQAPERATYFDPDNAEQLAEAMRAALAAYDPAIEQRHQAEARRRLPGRFAEFGEHYASLVRDVVG